MTQILFLIKRLNALIIKLFIIQYFTRRNGLVLFLYYWLNLFTFKDFKKMGIDKTISLGSFGQGVHDLSQGIKSNDASNALTAIGKQYENF
ncbi:MAG: hypothetical protein QM533_11040 [Cytophagales bacterium]|nr:hypothetical protein [Cytophagales bacterium]